MMKSLLFAVILFGALVVTTWASSDNARDAAVRKSRSTLAGLYQVLRNIAFPNSPYSTGGTTNNRFVLMTPGKVLNYFDYYPGDLYAASMEAKNTLAPHVLVPPSVMEKWFDIADVVVGGDLNSGDSGKSLAHIYGNILSQIKIKNFKSLYQDAEARYNEAKKFLTEPIQNPVNLSEQVTRMKLYSIYQEEYAEQQLNMEEKINDARLSKSAREYQLWFQRNFKVLNAKVESAYSKWLVFGQKELVELYKTFMDVTSAGSALEEARISLRASGITSLDRTRTIYPVSFEPSNWYEYLLTKDTPPSRDMLIAKRSMFQSELETLKATLRFTISKGQRQGEQTTSAMEQRVNYTSQSRDNATEAAIDARNKCVSKKANSRPAAASDKKDPCTQFKEAANSAVDATFQNAAASSEYFSASFLLKSNKQFQGFMDSRMNALEKQISEINDQLQHLGETQVYLGEIVESSVLKAINESGEQDLDSQWLQFDYNSDSSRTNTEEESSSRSVTAGVSVGFGPIGGIGVTTSHGKATSEMKNAFNSANLKASGELLRVFIKRPWFKPSLFDNPILNFVQHDSETKKKAYVSPPPSSEKELADIINGKHQNIYRMPEYVTSFLLARNVKLQFSGLDSKTVSKAMQTMSSTSVTGGFLMFSFSVSVGKKKGKQSMTADRTSNGMVIRIPGAQIIGYYTQVMPQFPKQQS